MTDPFARFQNVFLKRLGEPCTAVIGGASVSFNGVFRTQMVIKTVAEGNMLLDELNLDVLKTIADQLTVDQSITVSGKPFVITLKQDKDEGVYTTLTLKK